MANPVSKRHMWPEIQQGSFSKTAFLATAVPFSVKQRQHDLDDLTVRTL
jgi:hypothetical protein